MLSIITDEHTTQVEPWTRSTSFMRWSWSPVSSSLFATYLSHNTRSPPSICDKSVYPQKLYDSDCLSSHTSIKQNIRKLTKILVNKSSSQTKPSMSTRECSNRVPHAHTKHVHMTWKWRTAKWWTNLQGVAGLDNVRLENDKLLAISERNYGVWKMQ